MQIKKIKVHIVKSQHTKNILSAIKLMLVVNAEAEGYRTKIMHRLIAVPTIIID